MNTAWKHTSSHDMTSSWLVCCKTILHFSGKLIIITEGPIISKAILKSRWLLEQKTMSKVGKYIGIFPNVAEKWVYVAPTV